MIGGLNRRDATEKIIWTFKVPVRGFTESRQVCRDLILACY